tara:strand:+ start:365 stop:655 length:291 start_codon:yes stop_codon:yes gene_type:complete
MPKLNQYDRLSRLSQLLSANLHRTSQRGGDIVVTTRRNRGSDAVDIAVTFGLRGMDRPHVHAKNLKSGWKIIYNSTEHDDVLDAIAAIFEMSAVTK